MVISKTTAKTLFTAKSAKKTKKFFKILKNQSE